jgi:hypothetical protein
VAVLGNRAAILAHSARRHLRRGGLAVRSGTVEGFGENPRGRGFANSADSGENVRMGEPSGGNRVRKRLDKDILPHQFGQGVRPVLPRQYLVSGFLRHHTPFMWRILHLKTRISKEKIWIPARGGTAAGKGRGQGNQLRPNFMIDIADYIL